MDRLINRKVLSLTLCIILISVFTLTIAYAALSTTLNIIGNAEISEASWNIRFNNIKVNPGSVSISPKISNNTTITFNANLTEPGDFYKFNVDIVNDGTIDAMIENIIKTPELTTDQKKYLRYEIEYTDGQDINTKQILKSKETKTISVLFSFRNDIPVSDLPTTEANFNVQLQLVYYQSDDTGVNITNGTSKVNIVSGNGTNVGDEICIEKECFYVISSTDKTVTMLAKYNLYVSGEYNNGWVAYGAEATGIQNENMKGWVATGKPYKGTTAFSDTHYWYKNFSDYKYNYIYNENSRLYSYIENYKTYLSTLGVSPIEARLISYEELIALGCDSLSCTTAYDWVHGTAYWTGTYYTGDTSCVWRVSSSGNFNYNKYSYGDNFGCRPVITINTIEL